MDAMEMLRTRRSVRNYKDKPLEPGIAEAIADAGRLAASGRGVDPWEFVLVTDPVRRKKLAGICDAGKFIEQAPLCIVVLCRDTKYYLEDGAAATQNMLLAATALGLGSCWVAGDKKHYAGKVEELVCAPPDCKLISLVAVGHAADDLPPRKQRRPLAAMIHHEKF